VQICVPHVLATCGASPYFLVRTGNAAFGAGALARRKRRTRQCPGAGGQQRGQDDAVRELPDEATIRRPLGLPFTPPEQCQGGLL